MSGGAVKPRMAGVAAKSSAQARTGSAPTQPASEPLRTGATAQPTTAK
jgi:hypothetical protein